MKITLVENTFCNLQSVGNSLGKSYTKFYQKIVAVNKQTIALSL